MTEDPYSRTDYRRLIGWQARIERERPLLESLLTDAADRSVLDVGCGTGEHTAFFGSLGARAVGVDRSESMLAKARDHAREQHVRFLHGDACDLGATLAGEQPFALAICLGNMLPGVLEVEALQRFLGGVRNALRDDGALLVQLLNYERILDQGVRHLPLNFREGDTPEEEIVFLRLIKPISAERVLFCPTTMVLDSSSEEAPVRVESTQRIELRPWTRPDLTQQFEQAGFRLTCYGDMQRNKYDPTNSTDLVIVAHR